MDSTTVLGNILKMGSNLQPLAGPGAQEIIDPFDLNLGALTEKLDQIRLDRERQEEQLRSLQEGVRNIKQQLLDQAAQVASVGEDARALRQDLDRLREAMLHREYVRPIVLRVRVRLGTPSRAQQRELSFWLLATCVVKD